MLAQAWKVRSLPYAQPTYGLLTNGVRFPSVRYAQYYWLTCPVRTAAAATR